LAGVTGRRKVMYDFIGTTAVLGVLIPIFAIVITGIIIIFAIQRNYKTRQLEHHERIAAIEKGVDIPMSAPSRTKPHYPFTWPFIFIAFGLALILIYILVPHSDGDTLGFGLVIAFIGGGLFASRFYGVKKEEMDEKEQNLVKEVNGESASK
jgi:Na+/glutamate symporter